MFDINYSTKLIKLLVTFSKEERKRFYLYLDSPYFNKRKDILQLYCILEKRKAIEEPVAACVVIRKLFPDDYKSNKEEIREKDYNRLKVAMTALAAKAEEFITQQGCEKDKQAREQTLINELMIRKLYGKARKIQGKSFDKNISQDLRSLKFYLDSYRLEEFKYYLGILEDNRSTENCVMKVIQPFRAFYFITILRYCCAAVNQMRIIKKEYDLSFADGNIRFLKASFDGQPILVQIYFCVLMFLREIDAENHYKKTKLLVEKAKGSLDNTELRQLFNFMTNFCTAQIRKGESAYRKELFSISKDNIDSGIWNDGLYLSANYFNIFANNALQYGEIDAAVEFITSNIEKLNPKYREDMTHLSNARIYFVKGQYELSDLHLKEFKAKEDFFYKIHAKTLRIKLDFELKKDLEEIRKSLRNLEVYLAPTRNIDLSNIVRNTYVEFRKFAYRLCSYRANPNAQNKTSTLLQQIEEAPNLAERRWLKEKGKALLKKRF